MSLAVAAIFYGSIWPQSATAADPAPGVAPSTTEQELRDAMRQIDCASLRIRTSPGGTRTISGTVPTDAERTRLVELAKRLVPRDQLGVDIEILPAPLCGSLLVFDRMRPTATASEAAIDAQLTGGGSTLREGDPIRVEVKAGSSPVNLRIDYFSLDGQVLHMLPNRDQPGVTLGAGARRVFGASGGAGDSWNAGGAPFGTEFIAVTATPQGLDLARRPDAELAATYLKDLESALQRSRQSGGRAPVVATVLLHTSEREPVAVKEPPPPKAEGSVSGTPSEQPNPPPVASRVEPAAPMLGSPAPAPASTAASGRAPPVGSATPVPDRSKPGILDQLLRAAATAVRHGGLNFAAVVLGTMAVAAVLLRRRREMATHADLDGATPARTGFFRRAAALRSGVRSASAETNTESFMRWAGGNRVTLAIVFTDIVGSTALGENLKDQRMGELRTAHFARSSKLIGEQGGHEIKTIGDSVMVAFRTVNNALDYACELHRDPGGAELPGGAQLRIRAGIHIGPMSVEKGDVFGRAVNFAARVIGAITGPEIWVSEQAKADIDALGAGHHQDLQWQRHEDIEVKGFTGAVTLYSLVTDQQSVSEPAEMPGSTGWAATGDAC
jgi:class 3 adenylate cyclase